MANFNSAEINGEKCLCNAKKHWVKVSDKRDVNGKFQQLVLDFCKL